MTAPASKRQLPAAKTAGATSLAALVAWLGGECWTRLGRIEETVRAVEIRQAEDRSLRVELDRASEERDELRAQLDELERAIKLNASKAHHLHALIQKERSQ